MASDAFRYRVEYALFRGAEAALGVAGWQGRVVAGQALGGLWHRMDRRRRNLARAHVARAFPDWPAARVDALVRAHFAHLGVTAAEFLGLSRCSREELLACWRFEGEEHLRAARAAGQGALLLMAHLGNWELACAALAARGDPLAAVARRLKNPWVDARVTRLRERFGLRVLAHRGAARPVLGALRRGEVVAFLLDQRALSREGVESRFFGRPVSTNRGLATLALRTGAPVVPAFAERTGAAHVLRFGPPLEPPGPGPLDERIAAYTRTYDAAIEAAVRRRPEQWFWLHRRWRLPGEPR
ncbi:MAG: lysophospholipid acyltransferase family protein [Deferrisomatales bacterium]